MTTFTAAVIGLGQIGQGYDYEESTDARVLTHATAYATHLGFELEAGVDPDPDRRARFTNKFKKPAYADLSELLEHHQPQIFSICTPTSTHAQVFDQLLKATPLAVLCEKPLATTVADAQAMVISADQHHCALLVNYMRRFEPGVLMMKSLINQGELGKVYKGIVWYSKGLLNNGSHYVDLLRFLLGECQSMKIIAKGRICDSADPEPDVRLTFDATDVYFLALREECFSIADMQLVGEHGRVDYADGGSNICYRKAVPDLVFPGYTILNPEPVVIKNNYHRYQWHVVDNMYEHLIANRPLNSDGNTALGTLKVIENIFSELGTS